jgi:PAS domain S-box-containing protein
LAEEALRESKQKYHLIVDNMADVITVLDMNLRFTYVSPSIMRLRGHTPEEAMAQPLEQMMTPESLQIVVKALEEEMALETSGTADPGRSRILELEEYRKDGSIAWSEDHLSFMRDEAKKAVGIISVSHDITERKRIEKELAQSYDLLTNLARQVPGVVYQYRLYPDGRSAFPYSSPGMNDIYEVTPEDVREDATPVFGRLHPDDYNHVVDSIQESARTLQTFHCEFRVILPRQGLCWRWSQAHPERLVDGSTLWHGIISDITARKQAEQKLEHTLESLRKAVSTTVQVMVSAVETRDPYTSGHQLRSADLARAIGSEMGLPPDKIEGIRMAGSIHDIGKLSIPAEILSKPTKLSEIEFSLIKEHARKGYEMLKDVESPWPLAEIVHQHHERMDGSGYPRHLKGNEILMEARILTSIQN